MESLITQGLMTVPDFQITQSRYIWDLPSHLPVAHVISTNSLVAYLLRESRGWEKFGERGIRHSMECRRLAGIFENLRTERMNR